MDELAKNVKAILRVDWFTFKYLGHFGKTIPDGLGFVTLGDIFLFQMFDFG